MKKQYLLLAVLSGVTFTVISCFQKNGALQSKSDHAVSYNFVIRPILTDKCYTCHGPDARKRVTEMRLDVAESAHGKLKTGKGVVIFPGRPEQSEVYKRISSVDPSYQMPTPDSHIGLLSETEIELVKKWIEQGAKFEKHWAFTTPVLTPLPEVPDKNWPKNEIDHFVWQKMQSVGLTPNEEADKSHLLKRVTLDLTGLPPTLEMQEKFAADRSPYAYNNIVDELLAQKTYGEKMAIYWLDVARYADSYGYQDDEYRTQWPWRDWLINAFNKNMHYDEFLLWQIAGDMLPNANKEQILATAFFRNHKYTEEGGVIPEEYRIEYNIDKTKTFGTGLMGLTVECAQCHSHKYDPISQEDYYRLFAFFNNSKEKGFEGDISVTKPAKIPVMTISDEDAKTLLSFINRPDTSKLTVSVLGDLDTLRPTHILNRGVYDAPGRVVTAAALPAVMKFDTLKFPQNRLGLAQWTIDKSNPLTARVFINQIWQEFLGRGIVKSTGDFGMQGDLPTNPDLLDWLAADFMNRDWDIKRLVRQIVTSATYRQSAKVTEEKLKTDPENIYLSRGPRYRLPAELVRDLVLSTSGLLNPKIGGPSVKPYQPKGLWESATSGRGTLRKYEQDKGAALYRRGMYTFIKLTVPPPSMIIFDASNRDRCEVKRSKTNTPLQALVMLNDPTVLEASRVLAERIVMKSDDVENNIKTSFQRIVCRPPTESEMKLLINYYNSEASMFSKDKEHALKVLNVGEYPHEPKVDEIRAAALMRVINVLYNMEETIIKS